MTPTRAKRNSKAPERFSSDDTKTDLTNGSSSLIHDDKSGNSAAKIKLKPIVREPLKVKLPKLKRPHLMQSQKQAKDSSKMSISNGRSLLSKIKLPARRDTNISNRSEELMTSHGGELNSVHDMEKTDCINESSDLNTSSSHSDMDEPKTLTNDDNTMSRIVNSVNESDIALDEVDSHHHSNASQEIASVEEVVEKRPEPTNSSGICCPCGVDDDLGVMVECEKCSTWQHGHCINVGPEEDAYEGYVCAYCTLPPGQYNDSLQQLTVGDKFQSKFEMLETFMKLKSEGRPEIADENQVHFTVDELRDAVSDLKRVSKSLEVKWKLLTSEDYNAELKIWKNPIWSDDPEENRKQQQQSVRFVGDIYKSNLKLNICNMLNKMHKRCQLMRFQISRIETQEQNSQTIFDQLLSSLDEISRTVEQFTDGLKNF